MSLTRVILTVLAVSSLVAGVASPQETGRLRIGDLAPPVHVAEWIQGDSSAASPEPGQITVVEFWSTWCPTSRLVLARQDSLLATSGDQRASVVAVTHEDPTLVRDFLEKAGWENLIIGCDTQKEALDTYFEAAARSPRYPRVIPFGFIIGSDSSRARNTILWLGPLQDPQAEHPLEAFETTLARILEGTYDLDPVVDLERRHERSYEILGELFAALNANNLDRLEPLFDEFAAADLDPALQNTLVQNMNNVAWTLATHKDKTKRHLEIALRACEIAYHAGGEESAYFVDTHARVLYEMGEIEEAIEVQRRAVELLEGGPESRDFWETLQQYRQEHGLPPEDFPADSQISEGDESPRVWTGIMNDIWNRVDKATEALLVRPSAFEDSSREVAWEREISGLKDRFYRETPIRFPEEISPDQRDSKVMVLYGTASKNAITRQILEKHEIRILSDGVRIGQDLLSATNPILIVSLPNPWNPALPVRIYTAHREEDALNLNSFFHGPTSLVLGRWEEGKPKVLHSLNFDPDGYDETGLVPRLDVGPEEISSEEAVDDLLQLHDMLSRNYAGYADLDWDLKMGGSSWSERTGQLRQQIERRKTWKWADLFELLREYLDPVEDCHFGMEGVGKGKRTITSRRVRFIEAQVPYFADVLVRVDGSRFRIFETSSDLADAQGAELSDVSIVETPYTPESGTPYLFPTLPPAPHHEAESAAFLLGAFADVEHPPTSLKVKILKEGRADMMSFPLHRARAARRTRRGPDWSVTWPPETCFPVLAVRTMNARRLQGMVETADSLRNMSHVVLDLRGNVGGSDWPAMQWCQRFSGQEYQWIAYTSQWPEGPSTAGGTACILGERRQQIAGPAVPQAPQPYGGKLFVLTDKGVASSGESFALLAGQIEGALLLGENTGGCVNYGNVVHHPPLPHSRIRFSFGRTRFVQNWVRPSREGFGLFPDYWLDTEDPIQFIADILATETEETEALGE